MVRILTPSEFASRREKAIRDGTYTPEKRKERTDMSQPRKHRQERLYPAMPPITTKAVATSMEEGCHQYPIRTLPKRVSNVVRKRREATGREVIGAVRYAADTL